MQVSGEVHPGRGREHMQGPEVEMHLVASRTSWVNSAKAE